MAEPLPTGRVRPDPDIRLLSHHLPRAGGTPISGEVHIGTTTILFSRSTFYQSPQTYLVMTACYTEVMNLGYKVTGAKHLGPLAWAFFIVQQYSFVGDKLVLYSGISEEVCSVPQYIVMHAIWGMT